MCGIAGALYADGRAPDSSTLVAMASAISHRGPDASGVKVFASGAGLSHRRLKIIDLSEAAAQPMGLPDGSAWLTFNGEIYNFQDLRAELGAKGWTWRSTGDTEVVLAAYREWGPEFVEKIDGMFALAIWDERERRLILARDRTGKKPLYLYRDAEKLLFGSEMKAILAHPRVDDSLDATAIPLYLAYGYVPTPRTHFAKITQLPPASRMIVKPDLSSETRAFWDFPVQPASQPLSDSVETASARIRDLFEKAVARRMVSDVPLGAFLSGGIDSTLVVAAMSRLSAKPVRTFAIGFEGSPRHDERAFAKSVAGRFHTDHTEFVATPKHVDLVDMLVRQFDEPFGDPAAIPTWLVSRETRAHVTVALTGDGGDELFCGYPRFRKAVAMELVPRALARGLHAAARRLPGRRHGSPMGKLKRSLARTAASPAARIRGWTGFFDESHLAEALSPELARVSLDESYDAALAHAASADPINRLLYLNARTYLLDALNPKVDRTSMAVSLETRAPFLDTALIDYVFRLPGALKQRGGSSKWILKHAFREVLPPEIAARKKAGFAVPLGAWFRGPLRPRLDGMLDPGCRLYPLIRRPFVERIAREHVDGIRDWGEHIWVLTMLESFLASRAR